MLSLLLTEWIKHLLLHTGLTDGNNVTQTPILWKNRGENATIHCSHTKDQNHYYMYWYRQLPGESVTLIVFTSLGTDNDFGNFSNKKFMAAKPDANTGSFTVKNVEPGDQGLYFCAVSEHSDTDT